TRYLHGTCTVLARYITVPSRYMPGKAYGKKPRSKTNEKYSVITHIRPDGEKTTIFPIPDKKHSKPLLPPEFIEKIEAEPKMKGYRSSIYSSGAHEQRLSICNWGSSLRPDIFTAFPNGERGFDRAAKRTVTHLRAMQGDVLALCELIRCGANPDHEDANGVTPIFIALKEMSGFLRPGCVITNRERNMKPFTASEIEKELFRGELVVRTLIEQHVDVNRCVDNISLLHIVCVMKNWNIIALLLEHGAKMDLSGSTIERCFSRAERARFHALVKTKSLPRNQERPPQACPCWSGKLVKDCHANEQPYPPNFICICSSAKLYEKCCLRKQPVVERRHGERRCIVHYSKGRSLPGPNDNQLDLETNQELVRILGHHIDPAYAYALNRSVYGPVAVGHNFSRRIQEECQQRWNALIDEYITLGVDYRSKFEIERAAKIGVRAGALVRKCEGQGCWKVERRDVEALKICAKCRLAVYCSTVCQKSSWPTHKLTCGSNTQKAQQLPSQHVIENFRAKYLASRREWQLEKESVSSISML
ncbi:hypothetical protein BDN70DRAFT_901489, partial [Pholiota conissans]